MALFDKLAGHASVDMDADYVSEFFFDDEEIIQSFQFLRDQIVLTNYGIYDVDVQGLSGKKVEVKFFPKKTIKTISFETAGTLDFDVDIKIGVDGNTTVTAEGGLAVRTWAGGEYKECSFSPLRLRPSASPV